MKILSLTTKDSGCGYHRIWNPTLLMQKEKGWVRNFVTPEMLDEGWDIVFVNRCWDFNDLIFKVNKFLSRLLANCLFCKRRFYSTVY